MHRTLLESLHAARNSARPLIMGIVNVTPDSFSDGGRFLASEAAIAHGLRLAEAGADLLDIGGESTRPGAEPVSAEAELERVLPVIEGLTRACDLPLSIDTSKPGVMRAAVAAGAAMINDVNALRGEGALAAAVELDVPVCLMHMLGTPRTMQQDPHYDAVVDEVSEFLLQRAAACEAAGLSREKILLDPGFGFGKNLAHNLALLKHIRELAGLGYPLLVGVSRKAMFGSITGRKRPDERVAASLAAQIHAAAHGAAVLRTHDVAEAVDAFKVLDAIRQAVRSP